MKKNLIFVAIIAAMFVGTTACNGGKSKGSAAADTTAVAKDTAKTDTAAAKAAADSTAKASASKDSVAQAAKGDAMDELLSQYESKVKAAEKAMRKAFNGGKVTDKAVNSISDKCQAATRLSNKLTAKQKKMTAAQKKKFAHLDGRMRDIMNGMNDFMREQMNGSY